MDLEKNYASDRNRNWKHFVSFCQERKLESLPAKPETTILYVNELAKSNKLSTIRRKLSAISKMHQRSGFDSPIKNPTVAKILQNKEPNKNLIWHSKIRFWFSTLPFWKKVGWGILIPILTSLIASFIFSSLTSHNDNVVITYKDIEAEFPSEHQPQVNDALENFNTQNYNDALTQFLSSEISMKKYDNSKKRNAFLNALIGLCYYKKDSLNLAEKYFLQSLDEYKSACICKSLADLYLLLYERTGEKIYLLKHKKYNNDAWDLRDSYSAFIDNYIKRQNFVSISHNNSYTGIDSSKKYAIVIGVNNYLDSNIKDLKYAEQDANSISKALRKIFPDIEIIKLIGEEATNQSINDCISTLKNKIGPNDKLIFYYSGHGYIINELENLYYKTEVYPYSHFTLSRRQKHLERFILPFDADINNLKLSGISLNALYSDIYSYKLNTSALFLIDACNNNLIKVPNNRNKDFKEKSDEQWQNYNIIENPLTCYDLKYHIMDNLLFFDNEFAKNNIIINSPPILINSSSIGERSGESSELEKGIFTYFLVDALDNLHTIDRNGDSNISIGELFQAVNLEVMNYCKKNGFVQTLGISCNFLTMSAIEKDIRSIAARAQAWYCKPKILGGGGLSFKGLTLKRLNLDLANRKATYKINVLGNNEIMVTAKGVEDVKITALLRQSGEPEFETMVQPKAYSSNNWTRNP